MQRITAVGVLGLMGLLTSPLILSQSTPARAPAQTQPQSTESRLEDALTDIALLKRVVREQDRRIADLEKALRTLQAAGATERPPAGRGEGESPPEAGSGALAQSTGLGEG
jgi:hypothetical protein